MFYFIFLYLITSPLDAMQESALFTKDLRLVHVSVAGIYEKPDKTSCYDSQKIYGDWVEVIEPINENWVKVKSNDEIVNYMRTKDLTPDNAIWRMSKNLWRIATLKGCVYPTPTACNQAIIKLPYNAHVNVIGKTDDGNWAIIELINKTTGYIRMGDIEQMKPLTMEQMLDRVRIFIGLPYIWGGASSEGYDCSGFTQLIARQLGYPMQRNASSQAKDPGLISVPREEIQPGDFVYFGKDRVSHVAFCIAFNTIIHAVALGQHATLRITAIDAPGLLFNCARRIPAQIY